MAWTDEAKARLGKRLGELWEGLTEVQIEEMILAIQGFSPEVVEQAMGRLYAKQAQPRRPTIPELTGEIRGGVSGMSDRVAAYREMQALRKTLTRTPEVHLRGQKWFVESDGLWRRVPQAATRFEKATTTTIGLALGSLTPEEVRMCLLAMREVAAHPDPLLTPQEIAADEPFWEERFDAAESPVQLRRLHEIRERLAAGKPLLEGGLEL